MGQIHKTPAQLGIAMQTHQGTGFVSIRSYGDTLTMAGLVAVAKTLGTYYAGLAANAVLGGYPTSTPVGGNPDLPPIITLTAPYVRAAVKAGDEAGLLASLVTTITTAGNTTSTGAQKLIPGPVNTAE